MRCIFCADNVVFILMIDPELLSLIEHEIRSPLTAVRGYVSLMKTGVFGGLSPDVMQTVDKVHEDVVRGIYLVNDFSVFLRMQNEDLLKDSEAEELEVGEMAKRVANRYGKEEQKGEKAKFGVSGSLEMTIETFKVPLELAVSFLLKHAVRSGKDGATVDIEISEDKGILVKDNGEKISDSDPFKPFLDKGNKNRSGLELFIAKEAVKLLPGFEIGLMPEYKDGNTFFIKKS